MSAPLLRRSLAVPLSNGSGSFVLPCKKVRLLSRSPPLLVPRLAKALTPLNPQLVFEYCETWGSNEGMRNFLSKGDVVKVAERYPGVEVVVRRVENRHPHLRGVYGTFKIFSDLYFSTFS